MELLARDDPEVQALDREEAAIREAEAAYRADPELAADLEESGWFPERTQAAKEGRAVRGEGRRQAAPVLQLPTEPGKVAFRPSPWAGFMSMLQECAQARVALLERRRPAILAVIAETEAGLRQRVMGTRVGDLGELVAEANELLAMAVTARGPIPRTIATTSGLAPARFREKVADAVELVDAALGEWSLLDPIVGDEPVSVISSTYGIQADRSPTPANGRQPEVRRYGTSRSG